MDVRAENRGRPHQKVRFFCGPGDGEKLLDQGTSRRKVQECPREIRTVKFMFMLFFPSPKYFHVNILGPAKTYILRGTPRTCAIKTRAVTDN